MTDLKPLGPPAPSPARRTTPSATANKGWRSRGYIPHCDASGLFQHIVFGLADALPPGARAPSAMHGDRLLDTGYGDCILRDAEPARTVEDTLLHDDTTHYRLLAWCVMPNHVHAVIEQLPDVSLDSIVQAWKSVSAHKINSMLGRTGRLWRREYFDRFMRDDDHLSSVIGYVEANPVTAKLTANAHQWTWSSARLRRMPLAGEGAGGPSDD